MSSTTTEIPARSKNGNTDSATLPAGGGVPAGCAATAASSAFDSTFHGFVYAPQRSTKNATTSAMVVGRNAAIVELKKLTSSCPPPCTVLMRSTNGSICRTPRPRAKKQQIKSPPIKSMPHRKKPA